MESHLFISPAFAQGASAVVAVRHRSFRLVPFILIFVIMWFLIIRPQQRRVKEHQEMIKNVRRGDTVVTTGGIIGKVTKVSTTPDIDVEIADGVQRQGGARHDLGSPHQGRAGQGLTNRLA